jgi:beta-lactamase superfamily II metal-dependent hydrolase
MEFEKDDRVVLSDKHSEHDGEVGTITQKMDTMFGDATYTISFEDGQETGVPADQLEPAADHEADADADADEADAE